jgi:hypothetical protein
MLWRPQKICHALCDGRGKILKEQVLAESSDRVGTTRQFLVHPDGRKLLVLAESLPGNRTSKLWYVELTPH